MKSFFIISSEKNLAARGKSVCSDGIVCKVNNN